MPESPVASAISGRSVTNPVPSDARPCPPASAPWTTRTSGGDALCAASSASRSVPICSQTRVSGDASRSRRVHASTHAAAGRYRATAAAATSTSPFQSWNPTPTGSTPLLCGMPMEGESEESEAGEEEEASSSPLAVSRSAAVLSGFRPGPIKPSPPARDTATASSGPDMTRIGAPTMSGATVQGVKCLCSELNGMQLSASYLTYWNQERTLPHLFAFRRFTSTLAVGDAMIANEMCITVESALTYITTFGYGKHIWDFDTVNDMPKILVPMNAAGAFSVTAAIWSKTSFGITLLQLTDSRIKKVTWVIIISMNIVMGLSALFPWVNCTPVYKVWDMYAEGTCWDPKVMVKYNIFSCVYSACADIALALLPWKAIWGVHMQKKEKIGVGVTMSMGILDAEMAKHLDDNDSDRGILDDAGGDKHGNEGFAWGIHELKTFTGYVTHRV
ncbi:hypothetical protein VTG60DRAFT_3843 [Thermothelomyces hinnuleus]